MSNLVVEILLRLIKPAAALLIALLAWVVVVGVLGNAPTIELALICWLSAAALILMVESGPL